MSVESDITERSSADNDGPLFKQGMQELELGVLVRMLSNGYNALMLLALERENVYQDVARLYLVQVLRRLCAFVSQQYGDGPYLWFNADQTVVVKYRNPSLQDG